MGSAPLDTGICTEAGGRVSLFIPPSLVWIEGRGSGRLQAGLKARVRFGATPFGLNPGAAPVSRAALVRARGLSMVRWGRESLGRRVPTGRDLMCTRGPGLRTVGVLVRALSLPQCCSPSTGTGATGLGTLRCKTILCTDRRPVEVPANKLIVVQREGPRLTDG